MVDFSCNTKRRYRWIFLFVCSLSLILLIYFSQKTHDYLSPGVVVVDPCGKYVYTALTTQNAVAVIDFQSKCVLRKISLDQNPNGLALSADRQFLYVSSGDENGSVEIIDLRMNKRIASISVGHTPEGIALSQDEQTLFVVNRFSNNLSVINLRFNNIEKIIPTIREPRSLLLSPDGSTLIVANYLPEQSSIDSVVASKIMLLDPLTRTVRKTILMKNGSQSVFGLACSADSHFLYVSHLLSRYNIPLTQLDRGWVNTNALTIVDLKNDSIYATLLLDDVDRGAANPSGLYLNGQENLYITLSGLNELMVLNINDLQNELKRFFIKDMSVVFEDKQEYLSTSLNFTKSLKKRISLRGKSPRYVTGLGDKIIVSSHFSPFLEIYSEDGIASDVIVLGKDPELNNIRKGELAFCDAELCYQGWQSCASCHPDGRMDGLIWDQMNDGMGNPKSTKSMLFSHLTPPAMITGIRPSAEMAVRKGILHILNSSIDEEVACNIDAYLKSLKPAVSPFLELYKKKDPEHKGEALFRNAHCIYCHNGDYYTDGKSYNVGTGSGEDEHASFDTPTLREIWRTSPYLYDGKAKTLREVLTVYNQYDKHGITQHLTEEELELLELYVLTL